MATFDAAACQTTIFDAVLDARARHGGSKVVLADPDGTKLTYDRLVLASLVLGRKLANLGRLSTTEQSASSNHDPIALLLPNVAGLVVSLLGLNAFGRPVAMLNYTAGYRNIASALKTGLIRQIVTSRRFIDKANLQALIDDLAETEVAPGRTVEIVYLEDVRATIGWRDKVRGALDAKFARGIHRRHRARPDRMAVLLFTSGTEGAPKGVALTNANIVSNARQIFTHGDGHLKTSDHVVNPLPMFHSFGLTAATLMPILNGMSVTLYPSPLHYREIPRLIHDVKATILFATDTFMSGYAKAARPEDFESLRFIIAGAERVKDSTRALWSQTRAHILEGYGATECSPVIAVNLPGAERAGSVGLPLPGLELALAPVEGISEGGRLMVKGPNVMAGYMLASAPGVIVPADGGWHDTGDIVTMEDGFITIRGRAKRFAKIAGEMISLAAVETLAASLWGDSNHVVVSLPDPRKGEQLILVTDRPDAGRADLLAHAQAQGFPELWVPRALMVVGSIPVLGSGKTDYGATMEMVRQTRPML
jgi:acyl-[acyl-carrier-protein]-phospholipid O-acyltransferase/long-chain-fatty-acid--[acyl-carrier-protein] ligase